MNDYVRITSAVPPLSVCDTEYNAAKIIEYAKKAFDGGSNIVLFPELAITGYTCADLFFQQTLLKSVKEQIARVASETGKYDNVLVFGSPVAVGGQLYNAAIVVSCGRICGIITKTFIPNYHEFYEKRWFSSSEDLQYDSICANEVGIDGDYSIPIGRNLIFRYPNGTSLGVEICEDLWAPIPPSSFLALNGAEIILNLSASNETISKRSYRRELVAGQSARCRCVYAYSSAGSDESTTDLAFSGHSIIAMDGAVLAENDKTIDSEYIISTDADLGKIRNDRMEINTFRDCTYLYGRLQPAKVVALESPGTVCDGSLLKINKLPFVPQEKKERLDRCKSIFEMQVAGLKKRMSVTGGKVIVGVSGGLDSTLALLVAVEAARQLGRPETDIYGITMPCFGTSDRTHSNSLKLMKTLKISSKEINIKEACMQHFKDIGHNPEVLDVTYENAQARERTQVLMDFAGEVGGFVLGTGDLSELALGWCTYNADHMSMYGVNASVPKTLVRWMIDSIADFNIFPESTEVLRDIIDTPISPELLPPDANGKISQETENIVGPYALHDFFLYHVLRFGFEPSKIYELARCAFKDDFDSADILKWLKNFYKRFFSQQFKRSCLPDGVKVGSVCLSPRGDWRMPSDASSKLWLEQIEKL